MDIQILEQNYNTFNDYMIDFIAVYPHGDMSHLPLILNKFNIQQIQLLLNNFFDNETLYFLLNINKDKLLYFIRIVNDIIRNIEYTQNQNFYQNFYQNNSYYFPINNKPTQINTFHTVLSSNASIYIPPHKRNK
jgi:hypothetical protein